MKNSSHNRKITIGDGGPQPKKRRKRPRHVGTSQSKATVSASGNFLLITPKGSPKPTDAFATFGKHSGKKLSQMPKPYLRWLRDNTSPPKPVQRIITSILNP